MQHEVGYGEINGDLLYLRKSVAIGSRIVIIELKRL